MYISLIPVQYVDLHGVIMLQLNVCESAPFAAPSGLRVRFP